MKCFIEVRITDKTLVIPSIVASSIGLLLAVSAFFGNLTNCFWASAALFIALIGFLPVYLLLTTIISHPVGRLLLWFIALALMVIPQLFGLRLGHVPVCVA